MDENIPKRKKRSPNLNRADKQIVSAEVAEKRRQALVLRKKGATYEQIKREMGLSTAMVAWRYVHDAIAEIPREDAIECKALAIAKLDAQEVRLNNLLLEKTTVLEKCRIETVLVKLAERRARLEGHDAPSRTELTGKDGAPLALSLKDIESMTDDQLERALGSALRTATSGGAGAGAPEAIPGAARGERRHH